MWHSDHHTNSKGLGLLAGGTIVGAKSWIVMNGGTVVYQGIVGAIFATSGIYWSTKVDSR